MNHRVVGSLVLLLPLLAGTSGTLFAQTGDERRPGNRLWATVGIGPGTTAVAGFGALRYATGPHLVSIRAANDAGITTGGSHTDVGVLYGRTKRWSDVYLQASVGLAYVVHDDAGGEGVDGVGVPLSVGAGWTPLPVLGLGLEAFGDVNGTEFFGGLTVTVDVGLVP